MIVKDFDFSDVLTLCSGRLVGSRHMEGVYEILQFMVGEPVFTHQSPRVMRELEPWLREQFPTLFPDDPTMKRMLDFLDGELNALPGMNLEEVIVRRWVARVREAWALPERVILRAMPRQMHTSIDPVQEAQAMFGDENVIAVNLGEGDA